MTKTLTLTGPPGRNYVQHPELAYASVITVKREGARQYQVTETPTGTDANVYHDTGRGRLVWSLDRLFARIYDPEEDRIILEKVHVIIEA